MLTVWGKLVPLIPPPAGRGSHVICQVICKIVCHVIVVLSSSALSIYTAAVRFGKRVPVVFARYVCLLFLLRKDCPGQHCGTGDSGQCAASAVSNKSPQTVEVQGCFRCSRPNTPTHFFFPPFIAAADPSLPMYIMTALSRSPPLASKKNLA